MRSLLGRNRISFVALCLIWGATWIGVKAGIDAVPPLLFASTRFMAAGIILLLVAKAQGECVRIDRNDSLRILAVSLLMISLSYGPLFWGMQFINSGTAAVLEMSLTPIALLCFAVLLREETWDVRQLLAIGLGVTGLLILFGPDAMSDAAGSSPTGETLRLWGTAAVASAAFTYGLGSVLARPLLRTYPPFLIAGVTTLIGGSALFIHALLFEDGAIDALSGNWGWSAWCGWLFLVIFGSLIGYSIYMRLLRDIGASRSGSYAFVSPIIAVLLGVVVFAESVQGLDVLGMLIMLAGAYLAMSERTEARSAARSAANA